MQFEVELPHSFCQFCLEPLGIRFSLESNDDVVCKSHDADLILTYVANGPDEKVAKDMSLYFPRFVKVELHGWEPAQ